MPLTQLAERLKPLLAGIVEYAGYSLEQGINELAKMYPVSDRTPA